MLGVDSLDELESTLLAKLESACETGTAGSSEMVFLRPRLDVPGTLGPVDEDVYLMISVSEGRRRLSKSSEELNVLFEFFGVRIS